MLNNTTIESWVSFVVLLGFLALLIGKLVDSATLPGRVFGGLVALGITLVGLIIVITSLISRLSDTVSVIEAQGTAGHLLLGVLLVLVVLGHVVLLVALVRRRLAGKGRRNDPGRDPEGASRRSRALLPDRMEGP